MPRQADRTAYGTVISMWRLNKSYLFCSSQERFSQGTSISDNLFMYMKTHQDTIDRCVVQVVAKAGYQDKIGLLIK